MKKFIFPSDEVFIQKYEELKSAEKVGKFFGCSKSVVLHHAKEINYVNKKDYKLSEKDKKEILDAYYTTSSSELAKKYNVTRGMITKLWYDNNLRNKDKNIYKINNKDYFHIIDSPEKAYFLGFIAADGCLYNKKEKHPNAQNILKITLQKDDEEILIRFKEALGTNKPLTYNNKERNGEKFCYVSLEIVSDEIYNDIIAHDLLPNKTYINSWAILDDEKYRPDYIRGYFDGDGSISKMNFSVNELYKVRIGIAGFVRELEKFKEYLKAQNINSIIIKENRDTKIKNDPFGRLDFPNKKEKFNFLKLIYYNKNYESLSRKQKQSYKYMEYFELNPITWTQKNNADIKLGKIGKDSQ